MRKIRTIGMFLLLLVSMLSLPLLTTAAAIDSLEVEVNDHSVNLDGGTIVHLDKGEDVEVTVRLGGFSTGGTVNLRASVDFDSDDHRDLEDSTGRFDLSSGIRTKYLHLELPEDLEADSYTLKVWDDDTGKDSPLATVTLELDNGLVIQKVVLRPTSTVEAGRPLRVEVRVENLGSSKEDDIWVSAGIKDLGISTGDYLDELVFEEDLELNYYDETSDSVTLYLLIPKDAVSGEYDLDVDVEWNNGNDVVSTKTKVYVQGTPAEETKTVDTIISIDAVSKSVVKGGLVSYRLMLANLGDSEVVYSLGVQGTESWADVSLSPGFVRVAPNSAGELVLTVKPKDVAIVGDHSFTLKVRQGERTLRGITLNTLVSEPESRLPGMRSVLEIGFAVLVSLLVILGLVVVFKKLGRKDEKEPEPIMDNGQSYY